MASGLSPAIPFETDSRDGIRLNKEYVDLVNQNLKMVLLTSPGERIMDMNFGVGLRRYLFDVDDESVFSEISGKIYSQVRKYLPYLEIKNIDFSSQGVGNHDVPNNTVFVTILFTIKPLNTTTTLVVPIS